MPQKKCKAQAEVFVGTAGWDYPDWRGVVFPRPMTKGLHPLTYLSAYFDTVEVNSTFYRPARPEYASRWLKLVESNQRFTFTLKLWQRYTHERGVFPGKREKELFISGITPLQKAGRLGGILIQFPWSFRNTVENSTWLDRVLEAFAAYPLALEVRHSSWNVSEVYESLRKHRVAICNIDQPLYRSSIAPGSEITARIGYIRLHGRNHADWFREGSGRDARYNYLYSEKELEPWIDKIRKMRAMTKRLHVITNNHYRGQAAVNALQIAHKLTGKKVDAPPHLVKAYPDIAPICSVKDSSGQRNLF